MKREELKVPTVKAKLGASAAATNQGMSSRMTTDTSDYGATFLTFPGCFRPHHDRSAFRQKLGGGALSWGSEVCRTETCINLPPTRHFLLNVLVDFSHPRII
jgi:hypothetical protein